MGKNTEQNKLKLFQKDYTKYDLVYITVILGIIYYNYFYDVGDAKIYSKIAEGLEKNIPKSFST